MHENIDKLKDLDVEMYIISGDTPDEQLELYKALEERFGFSLTFVSDPELELIELIKMRNGEVAFRGYGMIDQEGNVLFNTINDLWGVQIEETAKEIKDELSKLK